MAGIGWGIEWLGQNKILEEVNTDEILEDVDDLLYKTVIFTKNNDFTVLNGSLGLFNYFFIRYRSKNKGTHRFRKLVIQECLSILEERIREYLLTEIKKDSEFGKQNTATLGDVLKTISPLYNVLNVERESILGNAFIISEKILIEHLNENSLNDLKADVVLDLLYLAVNFLYAATNISNNHYQQVSRKFIDKLIAHLTNIKSPLNQSELYRLGNVFILHCLYEREPKSVANLQNALDDMKKHLIPPISLNDWKTYVLGHVALENPFFSFRIQDQIFYS